MPERTRIARLVSAAAAATMVLVSTSVADGQEVDPAPTMDDGDYRGRMVLAGNVHLDTPEGTVDATVRVTGPMEVVITGGDATGTWGLQGDGSSLVRFDGRELDFASSHDASGAVGGEAGAYWIDGTWIETRPFDSASLDYHSVLSNVLFTCDQMVGRFDHGIIEYAQQYGATFSGMGTFVLVREPSDEETEQQLDELADRMAAAMQGMANAREIGSSSLELGWLALVRDAVVAAADLAASLRQPSPCPAAQQRYLEQSAEIALRGLETIRNAVERGLPVPTSALREATLAAVSTGATSEPAGQDELDAVRAEVQERWLEEISSDAFDPSDPELLRLAAFAAEMGWDLPTTDGGQISGRDALVVLGGEPG